jgi:hypothetical protein
VPGKRINERELYRFFWPISFFYSDNPVFAGHLQLAHCNLSRKGLEALMSALPAIPQLRALNLAGNQIDGTGCRVVAEGLREHAPGLQDLDLGHNRCVYIFPVGKIK